MTLLTTKEADFPVPLGSEAEPRTSRVGSFRLRVFAAIMLVVSACTGIVLILAQRQSAANVEADLQQRFRAALSTLHSLQEQRQAALAERCRQLSRRPRIVAALEDNALDVLYPTSADELRDLLAGGSEEVPAPAGSLHARFYRFLDPAGQVIVPHEGSAAGSLRPEEEKQLSLPGLPEAFQLGYLSRTEGAPTGVDEIIATPILSTETREPISALVVGFKPIAFPAGKDAAAIRQGVWLNGELHLPGLGSAARAELSRLLAAATTSAGETEISQRLRWEGAEHLVFSKRLNPGSRFAPVFEVCVYPLDGLLERQRRLRFQILGAGAALLCAALLCSHFLALRLARPVERLAVASLQDRAERRQAEARLVSTRVELERSARFSADASHQLKTPVSVLRAGLDELAARPELAPALRDEVDSLIHQTNRLGSVIEDLLLLSRMDAGHLPIQFSRVELAAVLETCLDDMSALPDDFGLERSCEAVESFAIQGEQRFVEIIIQNLLVNAQKYNRPQGRVQVAARRQGQWVLLTIGNTGRPIPPESHEDIFRRFHRGPTGGGLPGHGLGLNLARDLARLHGGDLRLVRSSGDWTEFEVAFLAWRDAA